jgi:Chromatin associated protein KTI12
LNIGEDRYDTLKMDESANNTRYEAPGSVNRWDSPLFTTVGPEDGIDEISVQTI